MGIPKDSVLQYETALKTDKFLLMVHGTAREVEKAKSILENTRPINMTLHAAAVAGTAAQIAPSRTGRAQTMLTNQAFERFCDPSCGWRSRNCR